MILWPYIRRFLHQWRRMALGLLATAATLLAGIGLLTLSGWFLSATAVAGLSLLTARSFNYFPPAGGVRFLSIARTLGRYGERMLTHEATLRLLSDLRVWLWRAILPLSPRRLATFAHGDLLNRLLSDIETLDHLYLRLLLPLASVVVVVPLLLLFLAAFDPALSLMLASTLLLSALLFPWIFYRLGREVGIALQENRRQWREELLGFLQGQAELHIFGALARYRQRLDQSGARFLQDQARLATVSAWSQAALILTGGLMVLLMLWLAADGVGHHAPPGPHLALMVFAAMACLELLQPLASTFQHLSSCVQAVRRIDEIVQPGDDASPRFPQESPLPTSGGLQLRDIHFAYQAGAPVLTGLDLDIPAGSHVAIIGASGSGKSSLFSLLTREWPADAGTIRLDGRDLESYSEKALRQGMSVMTQRVHLFAATLRDNLALALMPGEVADDGRYRSVLRQVGLEMLLQGEGLDAWIGDGGRRLSGGEQRRIGAARILLRQTPLILLDEPTEGLDRSSERDVLHCLLQAAQGRTLLMISHRPQGLSAMDAVYRLQDGRLQSTSR